MRKELDYVRIGDAIGGNQDWFLDPFMRGGGCAAVTACDLNIYLAGQKGLRELYPYNALQPTKEEYIRFSRRMKPYLYPRWRGIDTLDIYLSGIRSYWEDAGCTQLTAEGLEGTREEAAARDAIRLQIDRGMPVPYLLLRHKNPAFRDYVWHWFNLAGYEEFDGSFYVKAVTYGEHQWLDLGALWDTGESPKGGLILCRMENERD